MKKSIVTICFIIGIVVLTDSAAVGQIKIPKIFKPKIEQPTQTPNAPNQPNPATNNRQSNNELYESYGSYVDDGFTWFESVSTEVLNEKQMGVPTGWALKSAIRLMGVYPKRSAFKFVVSKAGKALLTNRCESSSYNIPANNPADVSFIFTDTCFDKTAATKETGKFDVEAFVINGDTNAETSIRKYKIEVFKVDRVNGQIGKTAAPDSPRYVISRHAESPVSFLYLRPAYTRNYTLIGDTTTINQVEIHFSVSPYSDVNSMQGTLRCSVDGKLLQFPGEGLRVDLAVTNAERRAEEIYSDRLAAKYQTGPQYKDNFGFEQLRVTLPLSYGGDRADKTRINLSDYPGKWECSLRAEGETLRTWRWTIGADGKPFKHAEQNGNINLFPNAYLINTEIPAGGTSLDKRLVPTSLTDGFFYGQPWTSAEGKAMAGKAPTKGSPAPLPSTKIK